MILLDTSVFVEFLRQNPEVQFLQHMFEENEIVMHPYVEGELILGGLRPDIRSLWESLPLANIIEYSLLRQFIDHYTLMHRGLGLVDCQLLASAKESGYKLFTLDKNLNQAAVSLGLKIK